MLRSLYTEHNYNLTEKSGLPELSSPSARGDDCPVLLTRTMVVVTSAISTTMTLFELAYLPTPAGAFKQYRDAMLMPKMNYNGCNEVGTSDKSY